jgi:hypothetical protein
MGRIGFLQSQTDVGKKMPPTRGRPVQLERFLPKRGNNRRDSGGDTAAVTGGKPA